MRGLVVFAVLAAAAPVPAAAAGSRPTSWATVWKMVEQADLIAVVTVKSVDRDENTMTLVVHKVLMTEGRAPKKLQLTYFAGDDLPNRVPAGSRALALLVSARRRWTPAYAEGYGVWSVQDGEVIEWLEGKRSGEFYSLAEVSRRIVNWVRDHAPR